MNSTAVIFSIAFFSGLVRSIIGFTTGTVSLALLSLLLPFDQALVISALLNIINNSFVWFVHQHAIDWSIAAVFGVSAIIFALLGSFLFVLVGGFGAMPVIVGCALILYACVMLTVSSPIVIKGRLPLALLGALSGFFKGFMGIGLGVRTAAFMALDVTKATYLSTGCFISAVIDVLRLVVYYANGISITVLDLQQIVSVCSLLFLGIMLGKRILWHVPEQLYRKVILTVIIGVGVSLLVREFCFS